MVSHHHRITQICYWIVLTLIMTTASFIAGANNLALSQAEEPYDTTHFVFLPLLEFRVA